VKEFGLVLFVFAIGLQLGPGFLCGAAAAGRETERAGGGHRHPRCRCAPLIGWLAGFDMAAVLGVFSGASVNMPSLGAATQTLGTLPTSLPIASRCPRWLCGHLSTAIVTSIATLLLLKFIFRINPARKRADYAGQHRRKVDRSNAARWS